MGTTDEWKPWILNGQRLAREIILTRRCIDEAARELHCPPDQARRRLLSYLADAGEVTTIPPRKLRGIKSPTGYFAVVDDIFALGLRHDHEGTSRPVATRCYFVPDWLVQQGLRSPMPDPFALTGLDLVVYVEFDEHCIDRFQERCNGDLDPQIAERQLMAELAAGAQAVKHAPQWARSPYQLPDFHIVTPTGYCLPMRNYGRSKPFLAATCLHRSMNPSDAAEHPPKATITITHDCGHQTEVLRSAVRKHPRPVCGGCGGELTA